MFISYLQHNYFIASNVLQKITIPIVIEIIRISLTQTHAKYPRSHVWRYAEINNKVFKNTRYNFNILKI